MASGEAKSHSLVSRIEHTPPESVDLLASMDQEELAMANRPPRDRYKQADRKAIEQLVRSEWKKTHGDKLPGARIIIEPQSWSHTYAATLNNGTISPWEIDRLTV